jgi:hypothetical protein
MGKRRRPGNLSRQDWIAHYYAKEWRRSQEADTPFLNLKEYNIFYKENSDGSWSYCIKILHTPYGEGEEWSSGNLNFGRTSQDGSPETLRGYPGDGVISSAVHILPGCSPYYGRGFRRFVAGEG